MAAIRSFSFSLSFLAIPLFAAAVNHEALVNALEAKFAPNKTGANAVVFVIQKDGVMAYPPGTLMIPENRVTDGNVGHSRLLGEMNTGAVPLAAGTRVFVTKVESKNELVKVHVSTMDKFDTTVIGMAAQKRVNAVLTFKFAKEFLNNATAEQVLPQIAAILGPDTGPPTGQATASGAPPAPPTPAEAPPQTPQSFAPVAPPPPPADAAPAAPAKPAAPPASISMGQTVDQVVAILGQPQQTLDLPGKKKQFVYPDLKITFTNGKVSDVQ